MSDKYFLTEGIRCATPEKNVNSRLRVIRVPARFPFKPKGITAYESIAELRKKEPKWKQLKREAPRVADRICEPNFILDCADFILTPMDESFNKYSFDLLKHTIQGDYDNDFKGLHLISKYNNDITHVEEIEPPDSNGVWVGKVSLCNKRQNNKMYQKVSTFFPKHWTATDFMFEAYHAVQNITISPAIEEYKSVTTSGIPVTLVFKNGRAKTIFPEYQKA